MKKERTKTMTKQYKGYDEGKTIYVIAKSNKEAENIYQDMLKGIPNPYTKKIYIKGQGYKEVRA
jgi:hypothetical protein